MIFSKKIGLLIILLVLLFSIGCVNAAEADNTLNETMSSVVDDYQIESDDVLQSNNVDSIISEESDEIIVEDWAELQYYSSLKDKNYVLKLKENTNYYPINVSDSSNQISFNNNVTVIGAQGAYIGDISPDAGKITYTAMKVPDNNGVGITFKNVTFKWIATRYQPDGVFLVMGGNSTNYFENCYFTNITTDLGHSSIVHIKTGDAVLTNCTFVNCTTDFGCLSVYNPEDDPTKTCTRARMNVTDSYFEGNYAKTEPGCINNCGILIVKNSTFYKNSAFWWAGAIHTHGGANTTIYDSDFIDNLAGWNGGALYTYSYLQIYNTRFIGNNCTTNNGGGAIGACKYLHAPYIRIEDSFFENNENLCWSLDELSTSGTGRGGAISFMDEGALEVYNSTFVKNSASIGTAICAINGGLSYGSPNVIIVGNRFINHTRVGDVLDVRVATGSVAEISNNYFENNSIVFSKLKLTADDPINGKVMFHLDAALKNPASYDADILDKSNYDVYVNGVYKTTVSSRTFELDLGKGNTANVYVVPCISNSKSNEVFAGIAKTYIYVSQSRGNDNNDGSSRAKPLKTLNKSIELARSTENIVIMDGTFKETDLVIDYNLTITAENNAAISVTGNGFIISDGDVKFENLTFKNCKYGSSTKNRIISQTSNGFLILEGCVFEGNEYKTHVQANKLEAENLVFNNNKDGSVIKADSLVIKSSTFTNNVATYSLSKALVMYNSNPSKFEAENLTFIGNTVHSGCILSQKIQAKITDCTFISNTGTNRGSAVGMESSGSTLIESCKFINNTDTGKYSSVIYLGSGVVVRDSIFLNNTYENTNNWYLNGNDQQLKKLIANNNWWGNTPDNLSWPNLKEFAPSNQLPNGWYPAQYILVLNATALDNALELNKRIPVQFIFTQMDKEGNVTTYDGLNIPDFDLVLTAVNGTCFDNKITVKNGMGLTYFTLTQKSSASLTGSFNGIESTINFTFKKSTPELTIDVNDINVGNAADIVVNVLSDATGTVILKVGNITKNTTISNSKATFSIPDLPAGSYVIEANYTGNDQYDSVVEKSNLTVNKNNSTTVISVGAIELNKDVIFTFTLSDGATGTIDVYVNGNNETINVGQTYTIHNISRGNYVVRAVYGGDSYYLPSEDEYSFEVGKLIPTIAVTAPDITYGDDTIINVDLDSDATGSVVVTVDGKSNTSQLNAGKATVSISGINAGANKVIDVYYSGDDTYKNATTTKTYNVGKASLDFTINSNNIKLGQVATVTIQLPQRSGGTLTISGIKSETRNIPLTGLVTLTYSDLTLGTYTVSAEYNGDNYQTVSKSISFNVSDWNASQWPNDGYDVKNTEESPYTSEANGNVKWIKNIDGTIIGNLAIDSEGRIYVVSTDGIYSINPADGSTNWIFNSQDAGDAFSGIAISRDTVLAPKSGDKLYFINQTSGEQYHNNIYQGSSAFAPVVDENANIYVSGEYYQHELTKVVVIPYKIWQTSTAPTSIEIGDYEITSSPVLVNENIVVVTTKTTLAGIDLSSKSIIFNNPVTCDSRPVVGPGNLIYVISNGHVLGYNVLGTKIKDVEITGTSGNYLSVGEYGEIYSINKEGKLFDYSTVEETLIYDFNDTISSRLLVGQDGILYAGSEKGMFYSIDTDGNLLWKINLNKSIVNAPVMDSNGVIYVISGNRVIAIDNASLKDSNLNAEIKNVTYGKDVLVNIDLDEHATGIVSIKIGDKYFNESANTDGKISFVIPDLSGGNYTAEISYAGDNRFDSKQINVKFNVGKINPTMNVDFNNIKVGDSLQINVTGLPSDATGSVSVSIDSKYNSSNLSNGKATLIIPGLAKGDYQFTVTYSGDVNYNKIDMSKSVSVGYVQTSFNATSHDIDVGEDVKINVTGLPEDADGVVYVNHNGRNYWDHVIGGNAVINIPDLNDGTYNFDVMYVNSTKYSADQRRVNVTVSKVTTTFNVTVGNVAVGENIVVNVSGLPNDATGVVIASIEGLSYNASVGNGQAKIIIPQNLTAGSYDVNVTYDGDKKYNKLNELKLIKISKIPPEFTITLTENINVWDDVVVDVSGLPLDATGQIIVLIDGISNSSEVRNGRSNIVIHQRLVNGSYPVNITYSGDKKYEPFNESRFVNISKVRPEILVTAPDEITVSNEFVIEFSGIPEDTQVNYVDIIGNITTKTLVGEGKFIISNLTSGKYSYRFYYMGDDKYESFMVDKTLTVKKIRPNIVISAEDICYGEDLIVNVTLPDDASGSLSIKVGEDPRISGVGGSVIETFSGLSAGNKTIEVIYESDDKYEDRSLSKQIVISKIDPNITIEAKDISVDEELNITVILPNDAYGVLNISVSNYSQVRLVENGKVSVIVPNLNAGNQIVKVTYTDDNNYNDCSASKEIVVHKKNVDLNVVPAVSSITVGDDLNIAVYLSSGATGHVNVSVDGENISADVNGGVARLVIHDLSVGNHTYTVVYSGDDRFEANSTELSVTVNKANPRMNVTADNVHVGENLIINVDLPADAAGFVDIKLNNISKQVEIKNGNAIYEIPNLTSGSYKLNVTFDGDGKYDSATFSKTVDVGKQNFSFDVSVENIDYGETAKVNISNLPADATGNITVIINNKPYSFKVSNGKTDITISDLNAGHYEGIVLYSDDDKYMANQKGISFEVFKIDPSIEIIAEDIAVGDKLNVTVNLPVDASGELNISVGDYSQVVNVKNGISSVIVPNLNAGNQTISVSYIKDANYNDINSQRNISVNKISPTISIQAEDINVGSDLTVKVYLNNDATGSITVSVDNISQKSEINNGIASFSISNLTEGIKTIEVSYEGNDKYLSISDFKEITVSKVNPTISIEADNIDYGDNLTVKVNLNDDASGDVHLSVGDKSQTSQAINGVAEFIISGLNAGNEEISVTYDGNEKYNSVSQSKPVVISKINPEISADTDDINVGELLKVLVNLSTDATGNVVVQIDEISKTTNVNKGNANIEISGLSEGRKTVNITYIGDRNYNSISISKSMTVSKVDPEIKIESKDILYGENLIISINLPTDATGNIVVTVGNVSKTAELERGNAILSIGNLSSGNKTIEVNYSGDDKYNPISSSKSVIVDKITPSISINADNVKYGEKIIVTVEISDDIDGNIIISIGNISKTVHVVKGVASTEFVASASGNQIISVSFKGDLNHNGVNSSKTINVAKITPDVTIDADDISYGDNLSIKVNLSDDVTGSVLISVGGISKTVNIEEGIASLDVPGLTAGDKIVTVRYGGDNNYHSASTSKSITVSKINTPITIQADDIVYGENLQVTVNLNKDAAGNVIVTIGDVSQTAKIEDGSAIVEFSNLSAGNNTINVMYGGDENYLNSSELRTVNVAKLESEINISSNDIIYGEELIVTVYLPNDASGNVTVSVDGIDKSVNVSGGEVNVKFEGLTAGNKSIDVVYSGDDNYSPASNKKTIAVDKIDSSMNVTSNDIGAGEDLTVDVQINNNSTGNVTITVGNESKTVPIKDGFASVIFDNLDVGNYSVEVAYSGDTNFNSVSYKTGVEVKSLTPAMNIDVPKEIKSGESPIITLELPKDATGTVQATLDGKIIDNVTLVNGTAKFTMNNITSGNHTLNLAYSGDGKYASVSKDATFNCQNKTPKRTEIIVADKFTRVANDFSAGERGEFFYAVLQDLEGNPLANKTVQIAVNGPIYEIQTDQYGKAGVQINLAAANIYTYALFFMGDSEYSASHLASSKLVLTKKSTSISASAKTFKAKAKTKTVSVTLKTVKSARDGKTYLSSGKKITLKVGGKTYTAKIDSKGVAKFNIKLTKKGTYTAKIRFAGDKTYDASSKSIKIKIK